MAGAGGGVALSAASVGAAADLAVSAADVAVAAGAEAGAAAVIVLGTVVGAAPGTAAELTFWGASSDSPAAALPGRQPIRLPPTRQYASKAFPRIMSPNS